MANADDKLIRCDMVTNLDTASVETLSSTLQNSENRATPGQYFSAADPLIFLDQT